MRTLVAAGGVAANSRLRADLEQMGQELGVPVYMPPLSLCGDNAAMIAGLAGMGSGILSPASFDLDIDPSWADFR